jgi:hypothetical protein
MNILQEPGIFIDDEIFRSGNPYAHAADIAGKCKNFGLAWCALKIRPENDPWAPVLRAELNARGIYFITWAQHLPVEDERAGFRAYRAQGHIANPETPQQDAAYSDAALGEWAATGNNGVIFTEGAWGKNPDGSYNHVKAARWVAHNNVGMPEAFLPINPGWKASVMYDIAAKYKFPHDRISPSLGIWDTTHIAAYIDDFNTIDAVAFSIWRFVGMNDTDWIDIQRLETTIPEVTPPPPPPPPATITVAQAYDRVIEAVDLLDASLIARSQPPLGANAALFESRAAALAAKNKKWTGAIGAQFAALRKEVGI